MLAPFALRRRTLSISCGTLSNSCGCGYMRLNGYFRYENHFSATKSAFTNILFLFEHLAGFAIYKSVELSSHQISLIIHDIWSLSMQSSNSYLYSFYLGLYFYPKKKEWPRWSSSNSENASDNVYHFTNQTSFSHVHDLFTVTHSI